MSRKHDSAVGVLYGNERGCNVFVVHKHIDHVEVGSATGASNGNDRI